MTVALVHDYLMQGLRGAERVLAAIHELYPDAPVYTLLYDEEIMRPLCAGWDVRPSFLQKLPRARRLHQRLLPLMPRAAESLPLGEYDLILSTSSAWVKSVRFRPDAVHVCFCHSPARFLWHWTEEYLRTFPAGSVSKAVARRLLERLRRWDRATCDRPTQYLANSRLVQGRIREYYGRESTLLYPPVETDRFLPEDRDEDYFLIVSALNPYKRVDLAVEACNRLRLPLVVVGEGPERERLRALAGPSVRILGRCEDDEVTQLVARCRAFLMPQEEDFGIAAVEAQSAGRPVIAYAAGGALETVVDEETGLFFPEQTPESLAEALRRFDRRSFDKGRIRENALRFSKERFQREYQEEVARVVGAAFGASAPRQPPVRQSLGDRGPGGTR
jgi:glycosyltransferase involved in cell wall biosynthesis